MMKPGNGGYNIGGDCEKGLGRLLTAWAFVYPVAGIWARVREIWQIGRVVVSDFLRRSGKGPPVYSPGVVVMLANYIQRIFVVGRVDTQRSNVRPYFHFTQ